MEPDVTTAPLSSGPLLAGVLSVVGILSIAPVITVVVLIVVIRGRKKGTLAVEIRNGIMFDFYLGLPHEFM